MNGTSHPEWKPTASAERYLHIDILRGLALFGVLTVNVMTLFRVPILEHIYRWHATQTWIDSAVDRFVLEFLEFKAVTIFSFLFGVGMAIQAERAAARNVAVARFLARRLGWLFVFGVVHLLLIWNGDILALYAICGMMLLPFLGSRAPALFVLGSALIALPEVIPLPVSLPIREAGTVHITQARDVYATGSFVEILRFRLYETRLLMLPLLFSIFLRTAGLMLWGIAAWRANLLRRPHEHIRAVWILLAGAIVLIGAGAGSPIVVALAYCSGTLAVLRMAPISKFGSLAAMGQMAFTNYLLQSIILGFIFYGYGAGLFGHIGSASAFGIAIALYVVQLLSSSIWLRHFQFGPLEWLWRSLTYGKRQVMRRTPFQLAART